MSAIFVLPVCLAYWPRKYTTCVDPTTIILTKFEVDMTIDCWVIAVLICVTLWPWPMTFWSSTVAAHGGSRVQPWHHIWRQPSVFRDVKLESLSGVELSCPDVVVKRTSVSSRRVFRQLNVSVLWVCAFIVLDEQHFECKVVFCTVDLLRVFSKAVLTLHYVIVNYLLKIAFCLLYAFSAIYAFGALTLLVGGRKGIRPVNNLVVGCWHGYLSGARCRVAYGLAADATATHCLLLQ